MKDKKIPGVNREIIKLIIPKDFKVTDDPFFSYEVVMQESKDLRKNWEEVYGKWEKPKPIIIQMGAKSYKLFHEMVEEIFNQQNKKDGDTKHK